MILSQCTCNRSVIEESEKYALNEIDRFNINLSFLQNHHRLILPHCSDCVEKTKG